MNVEPRWLPIDSSARPNLALILSKGERILCLRPFVLSLSKHELAGPP